MALEVIILAAGMGKRMHSSKPKVLHEISGTPMLSFVIQTVLKLDVDTIHVVLGHKSEMVEKYLDEQTLFDRNKIRISYQKEQLGTAHAVMQAMPNIKPDSNVMVLYGDTPLTPEVDLQNLIKALPNCTMSLLTVISKDPYGYGRIVRDSEGNVSYIVEEKDANDEQKLIKEVNTGMIATSKATLDKYLPQIKSNNAAGEFYLTDLVGLIVADKGNVCAVTAYSESLVAGVNNKLQLETMERIYQQDRAKKFAYEGLQIADTSRIDIRGELEFGIDCCVDVNVIFTGKVKLGNNVVIGCGCVLNDVEIGDDVVLSPYTVLNKSTIKKGCTIGPFAHLRPNNVLEDKVHIGNFVEVKNSHIEVGTKAGHLSYLGDSDIGSNTNIGAGTITCNYDGAFKHRTTIGSDVFIGSDTQLVAPVTVEDGATVGAGTTVTSKVPQNALYLTRVRPPKVINGYERPDQLLRAEKAK